MQTASSRSGSTVIITKTTSAALSPSWRWTSTQSLRVVGQASGMEYLHPDKRPQFFFNEVGVSPDWSSRGIGRQLSAALIEEARARGCESIWLATAVDNTPAHRCFEAVPEGEPPQMCRIYAWDLAD